MPHPRLPHHQRCASASVILCACQLLGCADGFRTSPQADIMAVEPTETAPAPTITDKCAPIGGELLCVCPNGVDTGLRTCQPAAAMPTQGMLTPCLPCDLKPTTSVAAMSSGSGASPQGTAIAGDGSAGAASRDLATATGAGTGGSSASAAGGSGGSAGSATAAPSAGKPGRTSPGMPFSNPITRMANPLAPSTAPGCECTQPCFPFGLIACCRMDSSCGCTWAPGAYCL